MRIDELRKIDAQIRFLSIEPLLEDIGTVDLRNIHWAIVGGESDPKARPMQPAWVQVVQTGCVRRRYQHYRASGGFIMISEQVIQQAVCRLVAALRLWADGLVES